MLNTVDTTRPATNEIAAWNQHFSAASPQELLRWGAERWDTQMALSCSFGGAAGMVLLDMVASVAPRTPILYIDTGLLFGETYRLIEQIHQRYRLDLRMTQPERSVTQQAVAEGAALWQRDPNRCCQLRKVEPLRDALAPFDAWITGVRRDGAATRAAANLIEWSTKYSLVKLNPLATWSEQDVWRYIHKHTVPYNPLLDQGYRSLGCWTCTSRPTSEDPRSGRWAGFNKTECGLHVEPV
jgi:phosphoadenosine phosphosulfate reductase